MELGEGEWYQWTVPPHLTVVYRQHCGKKVKLIKRIAETRNWGAEWEAETETGDKMKVFEDELEEIG